MKRNIFLFLSFLCAHFYVYTNHERYSLITIINTDLGQSQLLDYINCMEKNIAHGLIDDIHIIVNASVQRNILLEYLHAQPVHLYFTQPEQLINSCYSIAKICKNKTTIIAKPNVYFDDALAMILTKDVSQNFFTLSHYTSATKSLTHYAYIFQQPLDSLHISTIATLFNNNESISQSAEWYIHGSETMAIPSTMYTDTILTEDSSKIADIHFLTTIPANLLTESSVIIGSHTTVEKMLKIISSCKEIHIVGTKKTSFDTICKVPIIYHESLESALKNSHQCDKQTIILDAHYEFNQAADLIAHYHQPNLTIIITNTRLCYNPLCEIKNKALKGYPLLQECVTRLKVINPSYEIICTGDYLIALGGKHAPSSVARACTISRLYTVNDGSSIDIINAEQIIATAQADEKEALRLLAEQYVEPWGRQLGFSRHYPLWYGLTLLQNADYKNAYAQFEKAYERGLTDWRIKWYMSRALEGIKGL